MMKTLDYQIDLCAASRGYDRQTCWTQARAGALPPAAPGENPIIVLTMQKLRLYGSDNYEAIHSLHSTDLGQSWSTPVAQEAFRREQLKGDDGEAVERTVCDFWPKWHATTGTLLGTGHTVHYASDHLIADPPRVTPYAVYDRSTQRWGQWRTLAMPDKQKFSNSGAGCTQRVDLSNGEILLPIYFRLAGSHQAFATVLRCSFDGETLEYLEHGDELTIPVARGFVEPSLAQYQGRFFLALRNDERNYVAASEVGLHFTEPRPWRFDDGEELGSYNTQQHWVAHSGGLFLVYTRRGLNNDHVFRHRAPVVMAQVDTAKLCVLRATERVVIPERGARLGNFGVTEVSENETWIVEAEWMQNSGAWAQNMLQKLREKLPEEEVHRLAATPHICEACEQFGSDNTVWAARLLWNQPNGMMRK
jgi:hypothetical protein